MCVCVCETLSCYLLSKLTHSKPKSRLSLQTARRGQESGMDIY